MLTTRDRAQEIRELEELWAASPAAVAEPAPAAVKVAPSYRLPQVPGWMVATGWLVFLICAFVFEPASNPNAAEPLWVQYAILGLFGSLVTAAFTGIGAPRSGFAAATVAGACGMALSYACAATGHHLGPWWLVELGATGALTALSAAGLAARLRGK
jgi:hypothetical protein